MFISVFFFFFKQKTAYEMRISDWSSDVCSSDLPLGIQNLSVESAGSKEGTESRIRRPGLVASRSIGRMKCGITDFVPLLGANISCQMDRFFSRHGYPIRHSKQTAHLPGIAPEFKEIGKGSDRERGGREGE